MRFKVGDRVVPVDATSRKVVGKDNIGTVQEILDYDEDNYDDTIIRVRWDNPIKDIGWDAFLGLYCAGFVPKRLALYDSFNNKYYNVIRKIRELDDKFANRNKEIHRIPF